VAYGCCVMVPRSGSIHSIHGAVCIPVGRKSRYWSSWKAKKGFRGTEISQRASAESHLRTTVDFLLSHNLLLRSEMRLGASLPDFFTI
jgi:hypothetical protein